MRLDISIADPQNAPDQVPAGICRVGRAFQPADCFPFTPAAGTAYKILEVSLGREGVFDQR